MREDRPLLEFEDAFAVRCLHDHVRAQDVGRHQVRRELDAGEIQIECLGQRADEQCLSQARDPFQQAMAAHEQAGQHAVHDLVVSHDHPADLFLQRVVSFAEFFRLLLHIFTDAHALLPSCSRDSQAMPGNLGV